jgi:hypothetical protein
MASARARTGASGGAGSRSVSSASPVAGPSRGLPSSSSRTSLASRRRRHTHEAAGLGAAIDAAVGIGLHPDVETAVAAMVRAGERFEPNPAAARLYDDLYRSVYLRMYDRLQPLYREIRRITGYPPA